MEAAGDGSVRLALGHLLQPLDLALAQQPQMRLRLSRPVVDQALDDARIDNCTAGGNLAQRVEKLIELADPALEQIAEAITAVF